MKPTVSMTTVSRGISASIRHALDGN